MGKGVGKRGLVEGALEEECGFAVGSLGSGGGEIVAASPEPTVLAGFGEEDFGMHEAGAHISFNRGPTAEMNEHLPRGEGVKLVEGFERRRRLPGDDDEGRVEAEAVRVRPEEFDTARRKKSAGNGELLSPG